MAWTGLDDFDSYTTGADLNTLNGGSGWSAAWAKVSGGAMTIETAPAGGQGGKAIRSQSATFESIYRRTITGTAAGTLGFRMRISITNPNDFVGMVLRTVASGPMGYVRFASTGNIEIYNGDTVGYDILQASYSANTWYTIEIDWDDVGQPDKYRARVNGGAYSTWRTVANSPYTLIDQFGLDDSAINAHTFWVDDIGLAGATGPAPETRTITMVRGG